MPGTYQYDVEIKSNVAKLLSDMKQVQDRLDTVEGKEYKIKLNVDEKKLSSVISNLEKMLDSLGKGTGDFKQFENLSKELSSIVSEVQSLSKAFGKVDDSGTKTLLSSIQNIDKSLSELSQNILNVNKNMSNMGGNTSGAVKQVENISNAYQDATKEAEKLADAQSKIGQKTNISSGMKDAFHSDIDTSSSMKSLENLEEEIKKIFTDANELQEILDSLHNGKYFNLSWTTDGIDDTGADKRVRQLSELLEEYGYTINNFKSDSDAFDTSGVINAIKEENNVLGQNTQKVKENTQAKEQNVNVNLNKYDKRLDSYNGKIDKYKTTIDRFNDGGWTSNTYLENVQAVKNAVHEYETLLNELKGKDASLVTSDDISKLDEYEKKIKDTIATVTNMSASEKGYNFVSGQKELDKIHKLLNENSKMSSEAKAKIKAYYAEIESGNPSMSLDKIHGEILKIYNAEVEAGRAGRTLWDTLKNSGFHQLAAQMAGMFGFYDVINLGKEGFNVVRELNTAFTEMRKVSDETVQSLKDYQATTFDTADAVGTTAKQIQNSTADWMRLGESMNQAAESAKDANVLLNVSEFEGIDEATESLVSMSQAYKDLDKMDIIDVLNNIGNNYSISTDGLATALKDSASALVTANNDLNEAVSLTTAGNAITQDPSKVGAGLRTISLRLVGTEEAKQELSDLGEETDGMVTTVSKLRDTIMDATKAASEDGKGFDILDSNGNYKSTYEINSMSPYNENYMLCA